MANNFGLNFQRITADEVPSVFDDLSDLSQGAVAGFAAETNDRELAEEFGVGVDVAAAIRRHAVSRSPELFKAV